MEFRLFPCNVYFMTGLGVRRITGRNSSDKTSSKLLTLPRVFSFTVTSHHSLVLFFTQDFFQFASGPGVDGTLRKRAEKFKAHLTKKFRWDFEADLEDCAPVVVELPEGFSVE